MGKGRNKGLWLILLGMLLVVIDQIIKVAVKMEMIPGVPVPVLGRWFQLVFVENAGMAFGMGSNGGVWVKLALTLFRIGLFIFLVWWIRKLAGQGTAPVGVLIGLTLISAGALGNLLDSMFYGIIWPELMVDGAPFGFLFGKVVTAILMKTLLEIVRLMAKNTDSTLVTQIFGELASWECLNFGSTLTIAGETFPTIESVSTRKQRNCIRSTILTKQISRIGMAKTRNTLSLSSV